MNWQPFRDRLTLAKRILISAHTKIDGDGLGSEQALAHGLRFLGYDVTVMNPDPLPELFRFIGEDFTQTRYFTETFLEHELAGYDTLIVVDTSAPKQLPGIYEIAQRETLQKLVIDHHAVGGDLTPYAFVDSAAPAAGCLVMSLLQFLGVPLDYQPAGAELSIAEYLFFAIATDTGWFRFPSVQAETFRQAAELMALGVTPARLYVYAFENYSPARIKLTGLVADRAQYACCGAVAYSYLEWADFQRFHAPYGETTDLVNTMMMTAGVDVAILFCEQDNNTVRINFRSRSDFNVAELAKRFGGGGHVKAAGATLPGPLGNTIAVVVDTLAQSGFPRAK